MENQGYNPTQNETNNNFMIQQKLPNSTAVLVLGILSIIGCCCYGIIGLVLAIVGIVLANKDTKLYQANPNQYTGFSNVNTGRILCIIGLILSVIYLIINIYIFAFIGMEEWENMMLEWQQQMVQEN